MSEYVLGMMKLQDITRYDHTKVKEMDYADDLIVAGKTAHLRKWLDL